MIKLGLSFLVLTSILSSGTDLQSFTCDFCVQQLESFKKSLESDQVVDDITAIGTKICELAEPAEVCTGLLNLYVRIALHAVTSRYIDSKYFCSKVYLCPDPGYVLEDFTKWQAEVMQDMPEINTYSPNTSTTFQFLHVSDVHIDPTYQEGAEVACDEPICCHGEPGSVKQAAGYWGTRSKCDTPVRTVELFAKQASELDIKFMIWTGDSPPHLIWNKDVQSNSPDYSKRIVEIFDKYIPGVQVYPALGNHGCYPMDEFDPDHEQSLLEKYADSWGKYLDNESLSLFLKNGYYSIKDKFSGLRMIALNTQLEDNLNLWTVSNSTDPGNMLHWLRGELYKAEQNNEKVFIFGHIPVNDHFTESTWGKHYNVLINRFRNIITGQFFGHTHFDHYYIIESEYDDYPPAAIVNIAPSLTTYDRNNPSFRVFQVDQVSLQPVDYAQYRLPLFKANADLSTVPRFEIAYSARDFYKMGDLSPASYLKLYNNLSQDKSMLQAFYCNLYASYPEEMPVCDDACSRAVLCNIISQLFDDYASCTNDLGLEEKFMQILEKIRAPWLNKEI
jgi:sphingomyelin phosphodiesterase